MKFISPRIIPPSRFSLNISRELLNVVFINRRRREGEISSSLEYHTTHNSRLEISFLNFRRREFFLYRFNFIGIRFHCSTDIRAATFFLFQCHERAIVFRRTNLPLNFLPSIVTQKLILFTRHRSHRRCLVTESMMKTNCCELRTNTERWANDVVVLVHWNVVKTLGFGCKIPKYRRSARSAYDHILFALPDLLLMCTQVEEEKHDSVFRCCFSALCIANEIRYRVSRFILEYQISMKKKSIFIYFSLLDFVHLRRDIVSG